MFQVVECFLASFSIISIFLGVLLGGVSNVALSVMPTGSCLDFFSFVQGAQQIVAP